MKGILNFLQIRRTGHCSLWQTVATNAILKEQEHFKVQTHWKHCNYLKHEQLIENSEQIIKNVSNFKNFYVWELETWVGFFKLSNCTGTLRGFKENSGVLGLLELLPGSELLLVALARVWRAGSCVSVEEVAVSWFSITSLYLLVTKLTWLLTSWPASRRSRSVNKSRMTRASSRKQKKRTQSWWFSLHFCLSELT